MENLRKEIRKIEGYKLEYYESLLDVVERYIDEKPDIAIETCKSILEGISKLVINKLTQEPLDRLDRRRDLQQLFKDALYKLVSGDESFNSDLTNRLGSVVHYLGELRNYHGDISHGRASVKEQVNDADLSKMVIGITDSIGTYMLSKLEQHTDDEIRYEENEEFNNDLDEFIPLSGNVKYSKALFEQEPETYRILLGDYDLENNPEE